MERPRILDRAFVALLILVSFSGVAQQVAFPTFTYVKPRSKKVVSMGSYLTDLRGWEKRQGPNATYRPPAYLWNAYLQIVVFSLCRHTLATNSLLMVYCAGKWKWFFTVGLLWCSGLAFSQTANTANKPPTLLDGTSWETKLRLVYREPDYHTTIITVRFRISKTGMLDSLEVNGGPASQRDSLRNQLTRLNGKWKPQLAKGKPVLSKWMCFRWYINGYYGVPMGCNKEVWDQITAAYEREESLYHCTSAWNKPYTCRTNFIEGVDYFWYSPFYSIVKR